MQTYQTYSRIFIFIFYFFYSLLEYRINLWQGSLSYVISTTQIINISSHNNYSGLSSLGLGRRYINFRFIIKTTWIGLN